MAKQHVKRTFFTIEVLQDDNFNIIAHYDFLDSADGGLLYGRSYIPLLPGQPTLPVWLWFVLQSIQVQRAYRITVCCQS